MLKKLPFFFFLLLTIVSKSQQKYTFSGTVLVEEKTIKEAHIVNLKTNQGTYSNDLGEYQIRASLGDSLKITSVQYATVIRMVTKFDLKSKTINIYMKDKTYVLDEIVLKKTELTGSLAMDVKRKRKARKEVSAVSLGLPNAGNKKMSHIDRKIYTASSSSGGIPLNLLFNVFSGRMKKLREEKKVITENNDVEFMLEKIKHFLVSDFNIKKENHYRFLYFCRSDSLFHRGLLRDELALIKFLQLKSKEFNRESKEEAPLKNKE